MNDNVNNCDNRVEDRVYTCACVRGGLMKLTVSRNLLGCIRHKRQMFVFFRITRRWQITDFVTQMSKCRDTEIAHDNVSRRLRLVSANFNRKNWNSAAAIAEYTLLLLLKCRMLINSVFA